MAHPDLSQTTADAEVGTVPAVTLCGRPAGTTHAVTRHLKRSGSDGLGNVVGIMLEKRIAYGNMVVRAFIPSDGKKIAAAICKQVIGTIEVMRGESVW